MSSSVPRQPDPWKTVLISWVETPKSEMSRVGTPSAMASSAAVEDTVAKPRARDSASPIDPLLKRTASAGTRPCARSSAQSWG